jgi:hypothetical protein
MKNKAKNLIGKYIVIDQSDHMMLNNLIGKVCSIVENDPFTVKINSVDDNKIFLLGSETYISGVIIDPISNPEYYI